MWTPPQNQNIKIRNYILGWGKGVADVYFHYLDEKQRNFVIEHLGIFSVYNKNFTHYNNVLWAF